MAFRQCGNLDFRFLPWGEISPVQPVSDVLSITSRCPLSIPPRFLLLCLHWVSSSRPSLISLHFSPSQTNFLIIFRPFCSSLAAAERRIHAIKLFLLCLHKLRCLYVALYIYAWSHVGVPSVSLHKCVCWFHWQRFVNSW